MSNTETRYTVRLRAPDSITLHYPGHDILTNELFLETIELNNVDRHQMDELFRAGIVLKVKSEDEKDGD